MKYLILATGGLAALIFLFSIYSFLLKPGMFKPVAYAFLVLTIVFFLLVIVKKVMEDRDYRRKVTTEKD